MKRGSGKRSGGGMRPTGNCPGSYKPEGRGGPSGKPKGAVKRRVPV